LDSAQILDLTPTILHAMGEPVPRDLDGRVLTEAFDAASPAAGPVLYSQANVYKDGTGTPDFSDEEMMEVQEKLQGWGYAG
jgi:arylsulfatase A-like enzyme